ncbi:MAG TPA: MlaD family protein [Gemmatimonadaceae bacterium]|nr:MlaD family protein [Gemmatimonadaceae bacterium]
MKRRDEVTVGILLTVAVIVLITGTLWLVRGGLRRGYTLYTVFPWGQNLKQGQAVLLSGVTVGYVSDVRLKDTGVLDVDMVIQNKYRIPSNAHAEVYPVGIFGDVAVALKTPGPSPVSFAPGDTVPSSPSTSGLDALQARADSVMASLHRITAAVETEVVKAGALRDLRSTAGSLKQLTAQIRDVVGDIQGVVAVQNRNLTATLASFRHATSAVDSAQIASILKNVNETSANADSLLLRLSSNTTQLQAILARFERGEGTAGKLMTDTLLYRDARNLLGRVDSLLADFQRNPKRYINLRIF